MNQHKQKSNTRRFSTALVLRGSLGLFLRRAPLYLMLAAISLLVGKVSYFSSWGNLISIPYGDKTFSLNGLKLLDTAISGGLAGSLIMYPVIQQLRGDQSPYAVRLVRGMRAVGASLLAALVTTAIFYALLLLPIASTTIGTSANAVLYGVILVSIPACGLLYCMLFLCVPIATVERLNIVQVLKRSYALTSGGKAVIFAVVFVVYGALVLFSMLIRLTLPEVLNADFWFDFVIHPLSIAIMSVLTAYVYYVLVVEKDGLDTDRVAAHFD